MPHECISFTDEEIESLRLSLLRKELFDVAKDKVLEDPVTSRAKEIISELPKLADEEEDSLAESYLIARLGFLTEEYAKACQPGTYNCHEAMDRTSLIEGLASQLLERDSILANPVWFKLAHDAQTALFNLYQAIGYDHLEAIPDNIVESVEAKKKEA